MPKTKPQPLYYVNDEILKKIGACRGARAVVQRAADKFGGNLPITEEGLREFQRVCDIDGRSYRGSITWFVEEPYARANFGSTYEKAGERLMEEYHRKMGKTLKDDVAYLIKAAEVFRTYDHDHEQREQPRDSL